MSMRGILWEGGADRKEGDLMDAIFEIHVKSPKSMIADKKLWLEQRCKFPCPGLTVDAGFNQIFTIIPN